MTSYASPSLHTNLNVEENGLNDPSGLNSDAHHHGANNNTNHNIVAPLTDEQLTLLTLRFDENEFGYLPPDTASSLGGGGANSAASGPSGNNTNTSAASNEAKGLAATELPAVAAAFIPFSSYEFVRDKQEHMSLEDLKADLATFSRLLESRIMQHIHDDVHEAFVTVSGQLGNMSEPLARALQPLQGARKRLDRSMKHLGEADKTISTALAEAQRHEVARQFQVGILQITLTHESACRVYQQLVAAQEGMNLVLPPGVVGGGVMKGSYTVRAAAGGNSATSTPAAIGADETTMRPKVWGTVAATSVSSSSAAAVTTLEQHDALVESLAQHVLRLRGMWAQLPMAGAFCSPLVSASDANSTAATSVAANKALVKAIEEASDARQEAFAMVDGTNRALQLVLGTALYDAYLSSLVASADTAAVGLRRFSSFLRTYKQLGDEKELAVVYRDVIVRPMVESVVSWKAVGEARKSAAVVTQILANIKALLQNKVLHIVPLLRDTFGAAINPIADIIWTAVCDTLVKRLVFLFSPSLPDVLHCNFTAAQGVLALLEAHCETAQELYALRSGADMTMWLRKWNLDVYMVQRTQEATESFDQLFSDAATTTLAITSPIAPPAPVAPTNSTMLTPAAATNSAVAAVLLGGGGGGSLHKYHFTKAFEGISELAMRSFHKGTFLLPLGPKQLKLSITMMYNGLTALSKAVTQQAATAAAGAAAAAATPSGGDGNRSGAKKAYTLLCLLMKDLGVFESFVRNDFVVVAKAAMGEAAAPLLSTASASPASPMSPSSSLSSGASPPTPAVNAATANHAMMSLLKLAFACVVDKRKAIAAQIQSMLLDGAMLPLQQGLSAASSKASIATTPCPSEASRQMVDAVEGILVLESLAQSSSSSSADGGDACSDAVVGAISRVDATQLLTSATMELCAQYQASAASTLQALHRRLKALLKVKRVAAGGAGGNAAMNDVTDFEKMIMQLYYDALYLQQRLGAYVGAPMPVAGGVGGSSSVSSSSSIFMHYFAPLMARGQWILMNKIQGFGGEATQPPPALWAEVNESQ